MALDGAYAGNGDDGNSSSSDDEVHVFSEWTAQDHVAEMTSLKREFERLRQQQYQEDMGRVERQIKMLQDGEPNRLEKEEDSMGFYVGYKKAGETEDGA